MFLFMSFFTISSFSQKIRVIDAYTDEIIEGVTIENKKTGTKKISNCYGEVTLSVKNNLEKLLVYHKNYDTLQITTSDIDELVLLNPRYEDLESVVLSVSRVAERKQRIPEQIEILTKKNIDYLSAQTSADLLNNIPGVRVQKSQLGGGSPVIRGMESNRVLLVVDGVRMNNAIYRQGHLQNSITVSPFVLDRTEVVFGPTSVVYGSDALGGVVHYYTKKLNYSKNLIFKNDLFYRHSTVNNEQSASISSYASQKKWASFTNVSFSKFDDLKMGKNRTHGYEDWGKVYRYSENTKDRFYENSSVNSDPNVQKNTGYHQLDILQKLMFPLHENIDIILNGQYSTTSDIPNFGKLNDEKDGDLKFSEWRYGPQERFLVSAQANFKDYKSILKNGAITLAYQNISESRINRQFGSLDRTSRFENVDVFSLNSDFYKSLTKKGDRKMYYGLELVHNKVASKAKVETLQISGNDIVGVGAMYNADTRYPDGGSTYSSAAVYTSYRQKLDNKNTLNVGIRLTSTLLTAEWDQNVSVKIPNNKLSLSNTALTGSIGYIYMPVESDKISFILSKGFRSPNVDDVGKIRSKSGNLTVPNTRLRPEHLYSAEVGYAKKMLRQKIHFNINAYYTLLDDYISRFPSSEFGTTITYDGDVFENEVILANTNLGQAYIYGSTMSAFVELLKDLKSNVSLTYTKGKSYDFHQPLSSIPPLYGNVSMGIYKPKYNVALECRFSGKKKLKEYNQIEGIDNLDETPNEEGTPTWYIFNLNSNCYLLSDLRIQFQLQNIFDIHYKEFGSSLSAAGRNVSASVAYSF